MVEIPSLDSLAVRITAPVAPGPADIIPGFLPKQGQLVIAGETDVGKSLSALEVCSSLTAGTPLWGQLQPTQRAHRILYVLGEHYNEVIQRLWQKTRLPMSDNVLLLGPEALGTDKWLVQGGKPNGVAVARFRKWAEGCDLVIFDPLAAFILGPDAENDNIQMRLLLDTMSYVTHSNGASCIVLAHQGKPSMDRNGFEHARTRYAIRGASAVEDAATNIFYMGRGYGESSSADDVQGKVFVMTKRKYKGDAPDSYHLIRDPETLTHRILTGPRPFTEAKKMGLSERFNQLRTETPTQTVTELIKTFATKEGISERTAWRLAQAPDLSQVLSTR